MLRGFLQLESLTLQVQVNYPEGKPYIDDDAVRLPDLSPMTQLKELTVQPDGCQTYDIANLQRMPPILVGLDLECGCGRLDAVDGADPLGNPQGQ